MKRQYSVCPHRRTAVGAIAASLMSLAGCATAPSERLQTDVGAVGSLKVYVHAGRDPAFNPERFELFSKTLTNNGMLLSQSKLLAKPFTDLKALENEWNSTPQDPNATHSLVLTMIQTDSFGQASAYSTYVRYEAVLWHAASKTLVWKGFLGSPTNAREISLDQRVERLAADAIRSMGRDQVISARSDLRDSRGQSIPQTLIPLSILAR